MDELDDSVFVFVLLSIDRPSYFSIVIFTNAVFLFCRTVGVNCDNLRATQTKVRRSSCECFVISYSFYCL